MREITNRVKKGGEKLKVVLTKTELAKRWGVDTRTIDKWEQNKIIQRIKAIPAPRYNIEHILKVEETEISEFSPLERKRLQSEIEIIKSENEKLRSILSNILKESSAIINLLD